MTKLQNVSWQAKEQTGYDTVQFQIDWRTRQAICLQGQTSVAWRENVADSSGNVGIRIAFPTARC